MNEKKINEFNSIWQRWEHLSQTRGNNEAIIHWTANEDPLRISYSDLINKAKYYSNHFINIGINEGDVCGIIFRHNPEFYPMYLGIAGVGALPAVLAYPNPRLHPDKFRQGLLGMSERSGLDWILTERSLEDTIKPLVLTKDSTIKNLLFPLEFATEVIPNFNKVLNVKRNAFSRETPFLLQHSSGTTGLQKPVLLSNGAVIDHIVNYSKIINLDEKDKVVNWLPLYHDMGLIAAFHLPLSFGVPSVQLDPFEWVLAPHMLLESISKEKGSLTWLPNFAYNVLADKVHDEWIADINLESLRMVINCSEPIRDYSHKKFYNKYEPYGLKKNALSTCYAMAETTFAVTQNLPDKEIKEVITDRDTLSKGKVKIIVNNTGGRVCISSGRVIDGCEIRIVDEMRQEVGERCIGEIAIKSVSMFDGYRNYPEKTELVFQNGWYYSGDYGFVLDDELFVIGRKKDIIIVAGKNIYPEDIEDLVSQIEGVIPGRVIAFGEENESLGTELISVIAESKLTSDEEKKDLVKKIKNSAMNNDLTISNIYIVNPKWLIKSSAGKPSRSANKQRILEEKLI